MRRTKSSCTEMFISFWPGDRSAIPIEYPRIASGARKKLVLETYTEYRDLMESKNSQKSGRKARVSGGELDSMLKEYVEAKKSVSEIAKHYGITPGALTTRAKKLGLRLRGRGRWPLRKPTKLHLQI